jgi:hypothetical protein
MYRCEYVQCPGTVRGRVSSDEHKSTAVVQVQCLCANGNEWYNRLGALRYSPVINNGCRSRLVT